MSKNGTKAINQAVSRNKNRFHDEFYFQLTDEEMNTFWSQNATKKEEYETRECRYKKPYAFTEKEIAVLVGIFYIVF